MFAGGRPETTGLAILTVRREYWFLVLAIVLMAVGLTAEIMLFDQFAQQK